MRRVLIVSNRLPLTFTVSEGKLEEEPSTGGLATGLRHAHERRQGWWIGWPGPVEELGPEQLEELNRRLTAERLAPVFLSTADVARYYDGFANGFIWPIFHYLSGRVPHRSLDWPVYQEVNQRFADAVVERYRPGDLIWVHDYQLMLVPQMIRARLPAAQIGFFLHIPFPAADVFRMLPHRTALLRGLMGADLIGFHTTSYLRHFASALLQLLGLWTQVDRVVVDDRFVRLGVFPMGVDAARIGQLAAEPEVLAEAESVRSGSEFLLLAIDRLDYTKGVARRLLAYESLLQDHPELRERVKLVNLSVPSRISVRAYSDFRLEVNALVGQINGAYGTPAWTPVHYMYRSLPERSVLALYRAADVMLVTPLRDGMNLVAKEYVAARSDERGVLVLSEFAGAADELVEAVTTNPYEIEEAARSYYRALTMAPEEQQRRLRALRSRVLAHDVHRWVDRFLQTLADQPLAPGVPAPIAAEAALLGELPRIVSAKRLVLLLDYDGTLVPHAPSPEMALPDEALIDLLQRLTARKNTEVHILSGRTAGFLDRWLSGIPLHLHAEHGALSRAPRASAWSRREVPPPVWQEAVRPVLADFARRTPGAVIELKEAGLAWHWRGADPEIGARQANELGLHLGQLLGNLPVELLWGDKVLEIRPHGVHKGIVSGPLSAQAPGKILVAAGNDRTDEDLFMALHETAITIVVGERPSLARFRVQDVWTLRRFLERVVERR
jgi:trehalose 6-phosphate synthase/phosphatase